MASQWFYRAAATSIDDRTGPTSSSKLLELAKTGKLRPDDLIWKEGMKEWTPAGNAPKLLAAMSAAASATPPQAVSPPPAAPATPPHAVSPPSAHVSATSTQMPDDKKKRMGCGKIVLIVVGALVVLAVIRGMVGEEDRSSDRDSARSRDARSATRNEQPKKQMYTIGQRFQLGDFAYTVDEVGEHETIGDVEFGLGERAGKGGVFLVVAFTIENLTNETQTVLTDDFELVDTRGRKYRASADATTALALNSGQDWILAEIQPGLPADQLTAFEIPQNSVTPGLYLVIPEKGFFSSGNAKVMLID